MEYTIDECCASTSMVTLKKFDIIKKWNCQNYKNLQNIYLEKSIIINFVFGGFLRNGNIFLKKLLYHIKQKCWNAPQNVRMTLRKNLNTDIGTPVS